MKLDVDGSSFRNSERVGFGGLIKDMEGAWLVGFSELLAIKHGLHVSWD